MRSLTYTVVGHIKTVLNILCGVLLFGDDITGKKLGGVVIAMVSHRLMRCRATGSASHARCLNARFGFRWFCRLESRRVAHESRCVVKRCLRDPEIWSSVISWNASSCTAPRINPQASPAGRAETQRETVWAASPAAPEPSRMPVPYTLDLSDFAIRVRFVPATHT